VTLVYAEMRDRTKIKKVINAYCIFTAFIFIVVGFFGYTTWATTPQASQIVTKNILLAPYGKSYWMLAS
jgi:amino acid permease